MTGRANPMPSAFALRATREKSLRVTANERLRMAPYSGPTTIAPTIRISELVRMPTAPMRAAMMSSVNQLGGKVPSSPILDSISAQTGVNCWNRPRRADTRSASAEIDVSTFSSMIEPR